jgi:hypothetical protein
MGRRTCCRKCGICFTRRVLLLKELPLETIELWAKNLERRAAELRAYAECRAGH